MYSVGYDHKGDIVKELMHAAWDAGKLALFRALRLKLTSQESTCLTLVQSSETGR